MKLSSHNTDISDTHVIAMTIFLLHCSLMPCNIMYIKLNSQATCEHGLCRIRPTDQVLQINNIVCNSIGTKKKSDMFEKRRKYMVKNAIVTFTFVTWTK